MTPMLQVMIGFGIGLLGAIFLTGYFNNNYNRSRKNESDYWAGPEDQACPICLEDMQPHNMQYFSCGHAIHDNCYRELRKISSTCPICRADL